MIRVLHLDVVHEIDCGTFRCCECAHLEGEPGDYGCTLFCVDPESWLGPFAKGEAKRTRECLAAEDALRAVAATAPREEDAARLAWARHGYAAGRIDTLRLVYVAAACAVVVCDWQVGRLCRHDISACCEIAVSNAYGDIAAATLETLAKDGCPVAREMLQ